MDNSIRLRRRGRTRMTHRGIVAALTASIALAACGSSSSGLSSAQLATKVNAVCNAYKPKIEKINAPSNIQDAKQAAAYFDKITPLYDQAITQISSFKADSDAKAKYAAVVTKFGTMKTLLDQLKTKADAADRSGLSLLKQVNPTVDAANKAAGALGATDCSKD